VLRSTQGKAVQASRIHWVHLLLCALLTSTPVLSLVHHTAVAHGVCVEHGETIHMGRVVGHAATEASEVGLGKGESISSSSATLEHGHEHCSMIVHGRDRFALVPPVVQGALTTLAQSDCLSTSAHTFVAARPLLLLAPKTSPPV
jgi:hypothetical protein